VLVAGTVMTCLSGTFYISSPNFCLFISNKPRAKEGNIGMPDVVLFQLVRKILPKQKFHIWKINLQGILFPLFYSRSNTFRSKWLSLWITTTPAGNYRLTILKYNLVSKVKGKAIPLQAWTCPEGSRRLTLPDFKTIGTCMW